MGLFSKKPKNCAVCDKVLTHKHKPKKEWNIKGLLCGDCHFDKSKEIGMRDHKEMSSTISHIKWDSP